VSDPTEGREGPVAYLVERRDTHSIYVAGKCMARVQHGVGSRHRAQLIVRALNAPELRAELEEVMR
jgi:hypothetical protein